MIKLTFLGDIMCEPLLLKAAERADGTFDFSGVFAHVTPLFSKSDYVVGNLETPLAGKEAKLVHELFSFNAPDEFARAVKSAGVDFVSTANNHCLDRGLDGLKRTLRILDETGLAHSGTYADCKPDHEPYLITVGNTKVAILPFTYGMNRKGIRGAMPDEGHFDLLHPAGAQTYVTGKKGIAGRVKSALLKPFKEEQKVAIKKALGMTYNTARRDDRLNEAEAAPYFEKLEKMIKAAREEADVVVFYPHVGGQFNPDPGRFTEYTVEKGLKYGADAVIASHPHVVQKALYKDGKPVFYSLGNFSMSPNSNYLLHENHPEYGLLAHLYIDGGRIAKSAFSIVKIIEKSGEMLSVYPVGSLIKTADGKEKAQLEKDVGRIVRTVTGRDPAGGPVREEYEV